MADRDDEQRGDWRELVDDELLKQIVPDPSSPDVNVLTGVLLGRGRDEKWLRIYTTLQLNQFVEVPVDRIVGVKRFPMGQIAVWIPADVNVQVTTTTTLSGDFLKGSIQAAHGAATTRGVGGLISALVGTGGGGTSFGGCPTDLWGDPNCPIPNTSSPPLCGPHPPTGCRC